MMSSSNIEPARSGDGTLPVRRHLNQLEPALLVLLVLTAWAAHVTFWFCADTLWRDEAGLVYAATQPTLRQVWDQAYHEWMPIPVILMVRSWVSLGLGSSDASLRSLGLLIGVMSVPALVLMMRGIGVRWAVWTMTLWAINPLVIRGGDGLRGYGLGSIAALLAMVTLIRLLDKPSFPRWLAAVGGSVAAVQTLYPNSLVILTIGLIGMTTMLWERRWKHAAIALSPGFVAGLTLLPYVPILRHIAEMSRLLVSTPEFGIRWFFRQVDGVTGFAGPWSSGLWAAAILVAIVIGMWNLASRRNARETDSPQVRHDALPRKFAVLMLIVGLPLYVTLMLKQSYIGNSWHLLPMLLLIAASIEVCVSRRDDASRWFVTVSAVAVLVVAGCTLAFVPRQVRAPMSDMRHNAAILRDQAGAGDLLIVHPWYLSISLRRHDLGGVRVETIPPMPETFAHRYDQLRDAMHHPQVMQPLLERMRVTIDAGRRVWLLSPMQELPMNLRETTVPPPPLRDTGWWVWPYNFAWVTQLIAAMRDHGLTARPVRVDMRGPDSSLQERGNLFVIERSLQTTDALAVYSTQTGAHQGAH